MKRNVIVGQSGGPTSAINSSLAGVYTTAKERGAKKVYGMRHGIQGLIKGDVVDMARYIKHDLHVELLRRTPAAFLGSCRFKLPEIHEDKDLYDKIFDKLHELDIEAFIYIGGNDSMDTIKKLSDYALLTGSDIKFVGCPKTIDNDLALTDHTPGYGSAAKYIGTSIKEVIRDAMSQEYPKGIATVVEVMGRDAGWLTGASCLAEGEDNEGPDAMYLPEVPFDLDLFLKKAKKALDEKGYTVVAVSEGVRTKEGKYVCEMGADSGFVDAFGHKQLSGTASFLCSYLAGKLGCKTRAIELSTLQRAASHLASRIDIIEAGQIGGASVKAADEGSTGVMVVFERESDDPYQCHTAVKDVHKIANEERLVPRKWLNKEGTYVTDEFRTYVEPLIQGDLWPIMVGGIPRHLYMD